MIQNNALLIGCLDKDNVGERLITNRYWQSAENVVDSLFTAGDTISRIVVMTGWSVAQ